MVGGGSCEWAEPFEMVFYSVWNGFSFRCVDLGKV